MPKVTFKQLLERPTAFLAYGFGSGLAPKAPGTFGTLAAIPVFYLMQSLPMASYLLLTVVFFFLGIWFCQKTVDWLQQDDPSAIVWDEIVGFLITMIAAPSGWLWILLGFVLFRVFDILKPWPVSLADKRLHGGFGVMLDDVIAGLYALLILQLIAYFV
ncbi:phosphatidylglycerophosphatase A and related protein [Methylophaga aminisulfidivorans MP]|uniref:Phosphatidylglycerophosphatase A n=2 Tax=Methylophaga TaxID=40222 RepID=F5SWA1_9GAMM|nr:phosphatidylglycerophosphatase A and related protein [Methylophaga aminisulfidivorans MP]GLP98175.1 phosphatidylglycerophosphatase A [Methylophaga thalassica]